MRRRARVDRNQTEVVNALRKIGAAVQHLSNVGKGCPDLLVSLRGVNVLLEVKDGTRPPSERRLTPDEISWLKTWQGPAFVVNDVDEAIKAVMLVANL